MQRTFILFLLLLCTTLSTTAQQKETQLAFDNYHRYYGEARQHRNAVKDEAMLKLREHFHQNPYRYKSLEARLTGEECLKQLDENGVFACLKEQEDNFHKDNSFQKPYMDPQNEIGLLLAEALNYIWRIADDYRIGKLAEEQAVSDKVLKAILHYGALEAGRPNDGPRFHASCFSMPTSVIGTYFCLLKQMNQAEAGEGSDLLKEACDMLKVIGLQAWTQPLRHDETDKNVVSIPRFRNHVWWVGGNALAYRSLLSAAAMYSSVPMLDLLSEVCQRGISMTSQTTYSDAFWTEGFTADGAGWGHGMQCLIWGYPIDGTSNALNMLSMLRGTPWAKKLSRENAKSILNFLRGGNWYYYKGYTLPCLDRGSYAYNPIEKHIPYNGMLNGIISNWLDSFTSEEQQELQQLQREVSTNRITMATYAPGIYSGTRWFFNNDDLIKKTPDYHIIVNMASVRCDGLESAADFADAYNFYPTDGMTLFQRNGNEYRPIMGGWDVTASPGVTAREGMDRLTAVTNWRGYCSKHNYASGTTDDAGNAVGGYIFEKMNASEKKDVNDRGNSQKLNQLLYGFKAYKSYFILGDYMVALGAGVTNLEPEQAGNLRTTIDQTAWVDDVFLLKQGKRQPLTTTGVQSLTATKGAPTWVVQQGKFAYSVLPDYTREAFVACETRPMELVKRNKSNETKTDLPTADARILRLWANHGQRPVDDTYGYVVYTGQGMPADNFPFYVLRNDTLVQAVCSIDQDLLEVVLYPGNKGLKAKGWSLSASAPCTVLVRKVVGGTMLSVTDACMDTSLKEIRIVLNGIEVSVPLPQGMLCGKQGSILIP